MKRKGILTSALLAVLCVLNFRNIYENALARI